MIPMSLEKFFPRTMPRGMGTYYTVAALNDIHLDILRILAEAEEPLENREITLFVNELRKEQQLSNLSRGTISGRLSEMLNERLRLVRMVSLRPPTWVIAPRGRTALETGRLPD